MQDRSENHTTRFTIILCTKKPPELRVNHNETKFKAKCCDKIQFIQIYYMDVNVARITRLKLVNRRWTIDSDTPPYYQHGIFTNPKRFKSSMYDIPHFKNLRVYYGTISLSLEVCAVCSAGSASGEVYGCIQWHHEFSLKGFLRRVSTVKRYVNNTIWGDGVPQTLLGKDASLYHTSIFCFVVYFFCACFFCCFVVFYIGLVRLSESLCFVFIIV
jgi:hypothetical protein